MDNRRIHGRDGRDARGARIGRRAADRCSWCTASPAPRRTSPTTSTGFARPRLARPSPPTSAATARSDQPAGEERLLPRRLRRATSWPSSTRSAGTGFTLLGHSMGGMVAQVAGPRAGGASRLDGLVLMDTSHGADRPARPDLLAARQGRSCADGGMAAVKAVPDSLGEDAPSAPRPTSGSRRERPGYAEFGDRKSLAVVAGDVRVDAARQLLRPRPTASTTSPPGSTLPTLVIVGEQDRPSSPRPSAWRAASPGRVLGRHHRRRPLAAVREPRRLVAGADRLPGEVAAPEERSPVIRGRGPPAG